MALAARLQNEHSAIEQLAKEECIEVTEFVKTLSMSYTLHDNLTAPDYKLIS